MSIGRNKIKSVADLIKWLKLEETNFHDCDPINLMSSVYASVKEIWKNVDLNNYTDHGLKHSYTIIDYFLQLDESLYEWSAYEKFVFAISSLIHDIGMQYNKWGYLVEVSSGVPKLPLSPDDIRKYHTITGFELIEKQLNSSLISGFPKKMFDNKSHGHKNVMFQAQHIAFSHSGDNYINKLINDNETWKMKKDYQGDVYRPRLLAGILRICDELDGNFERIPEPNRITACNLENDTRIHWSACLFVEKIQLDVVDRTVNINIRWQAPDKSTKKLQKEIKDFLREFKTRKIQKEIDYVNDFFIECNEKKHCIVTKNMYVNELSQKPIFAKFSMEKKLIENILYHRIISKEKIGISKSKLPVFLERKSTIKKDDFYKNVKKVKTYYKTARSLKDPKLDKLLENWFEKNRETGHYKLINGDHTDTYLYCRSLVSDQDLLHRLTKNIWKLHKGNNIKNILAIGTSAIPIAVNLSFCFKCSLTYTVWSKKFFDKIHLRKSIKTNTIKRGRYHYSELIPSIREGENILLVDDVISSGRIVVEILNLIEKEYEKNIGKFYHHAIFGLGNRIFIEDKRIAEYTCTKHIRNIMYASSKKECTFCKDGWIFQKEEDMF